MKFIFFHKLIIGVVALAVFGFILFAINQFFVLQKAHSTFENYYAFRGCTQLLEKGGDYGICKTSNGQTIKIVRINNKWYLDGDGPGTGI